MIDELASIPHGIQICLVHYLGVRKRTLGNEKLQNVQAYRCRRRVKDFRTEAFVGSLQKGSRTVLFLSLKN